MVLRHWIGGSRTSSFESFSEAAATDGSAGQHVTRDLLIIEVLAEYHAARNNQPACTVTTIIFNFVNHELDYGLRDC